MAIKLKDLDVIAEDGTRVTGDMVVAWERAYDQGRMPDGYTAERTPRRGRPSLNGSETATITIRIPAEEKVRLEREAKRRGISLSAYVRQAIAACL